MKFWHEIDKDAFTHFQWFSIERVIRGLTNVPALAVVSVVGSMLFNANDRISFNKLCSIEMQKVLKGQGFITDYKLYLFANVELKERQSQVARYKKVWGKLNINWQLDSFENGPELESTVGEKHFFPVSPVLNGVISRWLWP